MPLGDHAWSLGMLSLFLWLDRKPRFPGFFCGLMLVCYGPVRFFLDTLRHPATDVRYLGWSSAQYLSIAVIGLGAAILWSRHHVRALDRHRRIWWCSTNPRAR